jgi:hypothetical protein
LAAAGPKSLSIAPDDHYAALIRFDHEALDVYSCRTGIRKSCLFPKNAKPVRAAFNWGTSTVATANNRGEITLYRFTHYDHPFDGMKTVIEDCLVTKDGERLDQIAKELEADDTSFPSDRIGYFKYFRLVELMVQGPFASASQADVDPLNAWLKQNSNSRLGRICRARDLISDGWAARGKGFASTVTPEGWQVFNAKIEEAAEILHTFRDEPSIPGQAYALMFTIARAQSWPDEEIEYYVARLFKEHPRYLAAHTARMEALLPRWGGKPGDCRQYAERVADTIGGPEGDAAYMTMVVGIIHYNNHGIMDELGFDAKRFQAGLDHRFRADPGNPQYLHLGLILASIAGDNQRSKQFAAKIEEGRVAYTGAYCTEIAFDDLLRAARQLP